MNWNWKNPSLWQRLLVALLIVAAASVFRAMFFGGLGSDLPYTLYYPAVMLAALFGGLPAGFLATTMSALLVFFWIEQGLMSPVEKLALTVFVLSCTLISFVCEAMRRGQAQSKLAQEKTELANQELRTEVTARKREEEKMRRSEVDLLRAQEIAHMGNWSMDMPTNRVTWSAEMFRIYGTTPETFDHTPEGTSKFIHPEDVAQQSRVMETLRQGRAFAPFQYRVVRPNGEIRVVQVFAADLELDSSGQPVRVRGALQDITERKRDEEEMRRMATVVRDSNDAITLSDFDGRITAWNRGAEQMFGYSEKEALQMSIWRLAPPDKVLEKKAFVHRLIAGEAISSFETQRVTKDGGILDVWLTLTKLTDADGKPIGIASTERDITERKKAEAQLQHTLADLERSNKELEQFAYVASHDLQEPLRMISSFTQLLAKRYESQLDDKARKYVNYTVEGAIRMQALINDLLAYSRVGTRGRPLETTDAHAVLGEAIRNLAAMIEENHALITNDDLPMVRADASQLVLVFQNLLANAIKFRRADLPRIHVSAQNRGHEWVFAVKDDGIGIEPQHAERVFVIFQRLHTREEYPGTGIGLAVCKRIVERHGGRIWFESGPGHGTTFFFSLPK